MKATLKLPVRLDVTLDESDVADAIEAVNAPFLIGEHRGVPMKDLITDRLGNVFRKPPGAFLGDLAAGSLPIVFKANEGRAALVVAYHLLKSRRISFVDADPVRELIDACDAILEFADHGTPVYSGAEVVADLRVALALAKGATR